MSTVTLPVWQGMVELGCSAENCGYLEVAEAMFSAAFNEIQSMSVDDPAMARKMRALAEAFYKAGNAEKALRYYKHALALYTNSFGKNDFETAEIKTLIAETFFLQDQTKMSVLWYRHAISTALRAKNSDRDKVDSWHRRLEELAKMLRRK